MRHTREGGYPVLRSLAIDHKRFRILDRPLSRAMTGVDVRTACKRAAFVLRTIGTIGLGDFAKSERRHRQQRHWKRGRRRTRQDQISLGL